MIDATGDELLADLDGHPQRVRYGRLVLATGARELFLPFPGWTLPGVVGVGGAQALLKAGARFSGMRMVVAGTGPLLVAVAAALAQAGARVVGIAEQAPPPRLVAFGAGLWRAPRKVVEGLSYGVGLLGVACRTGAWVREVEQRGAALRVTLTDGHREWAWDCDVLACGYGLVPNLELPRLLGCETAADRVVLGPAQETSLSGVFAAGELAGLAGVDHALASGEVAGLAAAGRPIPAALSRRRDVALRFLFQRRRRTVADRSCRRSSCVPRRATFHPSRCRRKCCRTCCGRPGGSTAPTPASAPHLRPGTGRKSTSTRSWRRVSTCATP